jgi:predicted PurR-regulated permease PerM
MTVASPISRLFAPLSWLARLGDSLTEQRTQLLADPQGTIATGKAWLASHSSEAAVYADGVGKNLAKLMLVILYFFYRDGKRIVLELRHVMARFPGARARDYLAAAAGATRAALYGVLLTALFAGPIVLAVVWAVWREWAAHLDKPESAGEAP